ncbi:MAG: MBL fold metallo-hydrolase [Saprospiraceae bacterium]|nr:MBL fold metallo-hydrolase [Saprospiraceae bacterium]
MKLTTIHSGLFKLDGGAMFGVVPKQLWKRINPPDDNNMCTWSMRCLLLEEGDRKILFDTGMGNKQGEKFRSHFEPHGPYDLIDSLKKAGVAPSEITDVFITHYHFDHVGGAVKRNEKDELVPTFENATYWSNQRHVDWATTPNHRERASFLKENFKPLEEHGVLKTLPTRDVMTSWIPNIDVLFVDGHTEKMMIPHISINGKTLVFCADLMPSAGHLGLPYVMAYDIRPLNTIAEKETFLKKAVEENYILFLEHDAPTECITVTRNERGKFVADKEGSLEDFL